MSKRTHDGVPTWNVGDKYEFFFWTEKRTVGKYFIGELKSNSGSQWTVYFRGDQSTEIYNMKTLDRDWKSEQIRMSFLCYKIIFCL